MAVMHLLIPFAAPLSEAGRQALSSLAFPGLQRLLARLGPGTGDPQPASGPDAGDEWRLSPPHERAWAQALGWQGADGCLPWAARAAAADGIDVGLRAWGLLSPTHWHLGTDQVSLVDPANLRLDEATSRALFGVVQPLFTSQGFELVFGNAQRWYAAHDSLAGLACASLDRVVGRNVDRWLGQNAAARRIRLLQSEVQMLLYGHPLNEAREAQGLLPVNSFWLSGCGAAQPEARSDLLIDDSLRGPALAEDWPAWVQAWLALDQGPVAEMAQALARGEAARMTLCGERGSLHFAPAPAGFWPALKQQARALAPRPSVHAMLHSL